MFFRWIIFEIDLAGEKHMCVRACVCVYGVIYLIQLHRIYILNEPSCAVHTSHVSHAGHTFMKIQRKHDITQVIVNILYRMVHRAWSLLLFFFNNKVIQYLKFLNIFEDHILKLWRYNLLFFKVDSIFLLYIIKWFLKILTNRI